MCKKISKNGSSHETKEQQRWIAAVFSLFCTSISSYIRTANTKAVGGAMLLWSLPVIGFLCSCKWLSVCSQNLEKRDLFTLTLAWQGNYKYMFQVALTELDRDWESPVLTAVFSVSS